MPQRTDLEDHLLVAPDLQRQRDRLVERTAIDDGRPSSASLVSANGPSSTTGSRPMRTVVAAVVGISRIVAPSLPWAASGSVTRCRLAISASSFALVRDRTTASSL